MQLENYVRHGGQHPNTFPTTMSESPGDRSKKFILLTSLCVATASISSTLQESVLRTPAVEHPEVVTVITVSSFCIIGALHVKLTGSKRNAPWLNYFSLSLLSFSGLLFTNMAVKYMDYSTRIVFKSAKLLPVMFFSLITLGKQYTSRQWLSAGALVLGIIIFSLGEAVHNLRFQTKGLPLITLAVCIDAFTGNYEEKNFFKKNNPCPVHDVICFSSFFSSILGIAYLALSGGSSLKAIEYFLMHPSALLKILLSSSLGYVSLTLILVIISSFGATEAELVKCFRRLLTIFLSFAAFNKPVSKMQICGFGAILVSSMAGVKSWKLLKTRNASSEGVEGKVIKTGSLLEEDERRMHERERLV